MAAALALVAPAPHTQPAQEVRRDDLMQAFEAALAPHGLVDGPAGPDAQVIPFPARSATAVSYRRRRIAVLGAIVALALGVVTVLGANRSASSVAAASAAGGQSAMQTVTVAPGQSLWDVAASIAPAGVDVRDVMLDLAEVNGITAGSVPAWTVLVVPDGLG